MSILNALKGIGGESAVPPCLPIASVANSLRWQAEFARNCRMAAGVLSDLRYDFHGKTCAGVALAASGPQAHDFLSPLSGKLSTAQKFVALIFLMSSPAQMRRVHAARIIARMKGYFARLSEATINMQGHVGGYEGRAHSTPSESDFAVTALIAVAEPRPALVSACAVNLRPKVRLYRFVQRWQEHVSHMMLSHRVVRTARSLVASAQSVSSTKITICSQAAEVF